MSTEFLHAPRVFYRRDLPTDPFETPAMSLPRVRFRVTRMMAAVACLAGAGCSGNDPQCMDNLHQIGHALHEFHDARGSFPKAAISDAQGRPGLSWRVAILPYLGQKGLYEKFKPD